MSVWRTGKSGRKYRVVLDPSSTPDGVGTYHVLGKGAFGRVILGKDEDGKYVAIKEITGYSHKIIKQKVDQEIEISRHLGCQHKNIACFIDTALISVSIMWVITEYIDGSDMFNIDINFKDDIIGYLNIAIQLVEGLEYMHGKGIAHRDIKPANIILRGPVPIYIDFDMSCIKGSEMYDCVGYTGTPYFLSPENWWSDPLIDHFVSDIYSLGVTFYYIFNDMKYPFDAETKEELGYKVLDKDPVRSNSGIQELDNLVMDMISIDPVNRPTLETIKIELIKLIKNSYGDPISSNEIDDELEFNDPFDDYF